MKKNNTINIKLITVFIATLLLLLPGLQGCSTNEKSPNPAKKGKPLQKKAQTEAQQAQKPEAANQEALPAEGYIYKPGDRRDPFVPLIVPSKKIETKGVARLGTLESYDITEFALLAIAQKNTKPYALLVTPDNRSFTVSIGTVIGFNKGRVEEITANKVVLVEYAKDFRGDIRPRRITLELSKER